MYQAPHSWGFLFVDLGQFHNLMARGFNPFAVKISIDL